MTHERPDPEVERLLESYLEEHAAPMPKHVLWSSVHQATQTDQLGTRRRSTADRVMLRFVAAVAAVAVVVVALVAGPGILDRLRGMMPGAAPSATAESSPTNAPPSESAYVWDAMLNFVNRNPAGDGYGHTAVWSYLMTPAGIHDPAQYRLLTTYVESDVTWSDPTIEGLSIGLPPSNEPGLQIQPADDTAAIVAWRNPLEAVPITISGSVAVNGSCGDGITLIIDHAGDVFRTVPLANGREDFTIPVDRFDPAEVLHFIVEPGANGDCDRTWLSLVITSPSSTAQPSPSAASSGTSGGG